MGLRFVQQSVKEANEKVRKQKNEEKKDKIKKKSRDERLAARCTKMEGKAGACRSGGSREDAESRSQDEGLRNRAEAFNRSVV